MKDLNLTYVRDSPEAIVGYSDADWAGDIQDRRSTSGNVFLLGGGAITWSSRKQTSVALLTVEAEYLALSVATQEAIWLRHLQEELGVTNTGPTLIFEDNQGAISMAKNPVFHKRTKHVQIRYHFVREAVEQGTITLEYCRTDDMLADSFTKALARDQFEYTKEYCLFYTQVIFALTHLITDIKGCSLIVYIYCINLVLLSWMNMSCISPYLTISDHLKSKFSLRSWTMCNINGNK